jgi:hypothetical protein
MMSDAIYLSNVRLSFPKLIEAVAPPTTPNAAKKFSADLIMPPNHPDLAKFMEHVGAVAAAKWKEQAGPILQLLQSDRRLRCWGNGNEKIKSTTLKPYEGYEGMTYIAASMNEDRPPVMVRPDGSACDNSNTMERTTLARKMYGGCYVNAMVSCWPQDNQFGRGLRCNLLALQFLRDGDPFGDVAPDVEGVFGAVQGAPAAAAAPAGFPNFFK